MPILNVGLGVAMITNASMAVSECLYFEWLYNYGTGSAYDEACLWGEESWITVACGGDSSSISWYNNAGYDVYDVSMRDVVCEYSGLTLEQAARVMGGGMENCSFGTLVLKDKSDWYPGQYCYENSTQYIMYRCDCTRGDIENAYPTLGVQCTETYEGDVVYGGCYLGSKSETTYLTQYNYEVPYCGEANGMLASSTVEYVCADTTDSFQTPENLCDCQGFWTNWTAMNIGAKRTKSAYTCGDVTWSTRCQDTSHNIFGTLQSGSAQYNCTKSETVEYQCTCPAAYYSAVSATPQDGETCMCEPCPCVTDATGARRCGSMRGASGLQMDDEYGYYIDSAITDCALTAGTFEDVKGTYTLSERCPYKL